MMAFLSIASDILIGAGLVITGVTLYLVSNLPGRTGTPPDPYEDVEIPDAGAPPSSDLTPYYYAGFAGATLLGTGVMMKLRGREMIRF